jgi:DNA-binding MarR family transcriptional regulator
MPPKACPPYMRRLLKRLNELQPSEPNPLKLLLKALQENKQGKGGDTVTVKSPSEVTVNLVNFRVSVRSDLELALQDVDNDLPNLVDLIRECPESTCGQLFWAGRSDKKACDKHIGLLRKRRNRQDIKNREKQKEADAKADAKRVEAKRRKEKATKTFEAMTVTARSVIRAIMGQGARSFGEIDYEHWQEFYKGGKLPRSTQVVSRVTHKLHKDGYLDYSESADERRLDRYDPTQKLRDLWAEID